MFSNEKKINTENKDVGYKDVGYLKPVFCDCRKAVPPSLWVRRTTALQQHETPRLFLTAGTSGLFPLHTVPVLGTVVVDELLVGEEHPLLVVDIKSQFRHLILRHSQHTPAAVVRAIGVVRVKTPRFALLASLAPALALNTLWHFLPVRSNVACKQGQQQVA
jgi:hypothetical protein